MLIANKSNRPITRLYPFATFKWFSFFIVVDSSFRIASKHVDYVQTALKGSLINSELPQLNYLNFDIIRLISAGQTTVSGRKCRRFAIAGLKDFYRRFLYLGL